MSRAGDLVVLSDIDTRLEHDTARLTVAEARLVRDEELDTMRKELRKAQRAHEKAEAEVAAQDTTVATLRKRMDELNRHLYDGSVRNPQELIGMQHELETLHARVAGEEESELALMETVEAAMETQQALASRVEIRAREHTDSLPALSAEVAALHEALVRLADERTSLVASIAAPDLALYQRIRARLSPAVVHLEGETCGGCHIPFAASEIRTVRSGSSIVQCSSCDRIVVP